MTPSRWNLNPRTHVVHVAASLVLLAGLGSSGAIAQRPAVFPGTEWERIADPAGVGYVADSLEGIRTDLARTNTTGLMVIVGGRVLLEYGDVQQVSYVASVRKSVLAMLYGRYVEEGAIDLQRTLSGLQMDDHLGLDTLERRAMVEHLISARSGIYHPASNAGDNQADAPPRGSQPPGEYFLYNNWDFNAAGAAFERMTGVDIFDALAHDLAAPIGMRDFDRARHRKSGNRDRSRYPAYHMHFSTRDMARIGYLMLRGGAWNGREVVPREWTRRIVSVVTPVEEMNPAGFRLDRFGYGYMWWVWDGRYAQGVFAGAYSAMGAFGQYITVLPALDMVIAHKTAVPPERVTPRSDYLRLLDRLVVARCRGACR